MENADDEAQSFNGDYSYNKPREKEVYQVLN